MKKDKTIQTNQSINDQLNDLLGEAKNILKEIDETNNQIKVALDDISVKVDESIAKVEKIYSDLDQIEKEAGDEIDKLILQQAEDLAEE
jgi:DNA repair ATPase RecN